MSLIYLTQCHPVMCLLPSQSGLGFLVYNGAGTVNYLSSASASAVVAVAQLGLGTEIFVGGPYLCICSSL